MGEYLRDTVLSDFVRKFSGRRYMRFPDEIDATLWKQCITGARARSFSDKDTTLEQPDAGERDNTNRHAGGANEPESNEDDERNVILVGWYGSADGEVKCYLLFESRLQRKKMC